MLALLVDHNVQFAIVRGVRRRAAELGLPLDLVTAQEVGLEATSDPDLLEWAAREGRVVLTLDINTLVGFAWDRVRAGEPMPGVFAVPRSTSGRAIIEDLLDLSECSLPGEWEGKVLYLPMR